MKKQRATRTSIDFSIAPIIHDRACNGRRKAKAGDGEPLQRYGLASCTVFYLDRIVNPAPEKATLTSATEASGEYGGATFNTTHWSVVLEAQGESPEAQEALEKLC